MSISIVAKVILPLVVLCCAIYLVVSIRSRPKVPVNDQPAELVTVYPAKTYPVATAPDAGAPLDAGVAEVTVTVTVEQKKVRPTPEQLVKEFWLSDLRELEDQATTPEDKQLIQQAIEIKLQRIKATELSDSFEKNMQKAIK